MPSWHVQGDHKGEGLMVRYVAASAGSGGYLGFKLQSADWAWLVFALACALISLVTALVLMRGVLAADEGTPVMREIAHAIQEGALAYLKRQYKTIGLIVVPVAVFVFVTSTKVVDTQTHTTVLGFVSSGIFRTIAFLVGATFSGLAGYIGMSTAVRGNVRTAAGARSGSLPAALKVAIRTGGVTGLFVVGFGLFGATVIVMLAQHSAAAILIGFGFGGSLLALFMRVGGGIFTKAADVGATRCTSTCSMTAAATPRCWRTRNCGSIASRCSPSGKLCTPPDGGWAIASRRRN
jgi:K(+)-stimulated pyrophosphate-energized sodium pump